MGGYIKLFRQMLDWEWYKDTNTKTVFLHILLRANREPSKYKGVDIPAGGCVFGRKAWAEELGLSERQVRTAMSHLISTNEVTIKTTNKFSVVTVVKWRFWQIEEGENDQQNDQHIDQQPTTSKEYINIYTTPTIEEIRQYVETNQLLVDPNYFFEYYEGTGWKDKGGKPVKNWKLKIRTWHKREAKGNDHRGSGKQSRNIRGTASGSRRENEYVETGFIPMAAGFSSEE